jgi:poly [ADP-ribose] polymerase
MPVVQESRYIKSDIDANNNKWWNIEVYDDGSVISRWGRVGEIGQSQTKRFGCVGAADRFYASKCREKEGKGYQPLRTVEASGSVSLQTSSNHNLAEIAARQIETSSPTTLQLVTYLTQANIHNILSSTTMQYDTSRGTFSTPLGIVDRSALHQARGLLTTIGDYVARQELDNPALTPHLNQYLMLIPQDIGRGRPSARTLYPTLDAVQRQNDILDALDASLQAVLSAPKAVGDEPAAEEPKLFEVRLADVTDGNAIDRIKRKYRETQKAIHGSSVLDVKRVYSVELGSMNRAFDTDGAKLDNIWELWHGSKKGNLLSIMAKGFVIPPQNSAHCTGRMFGNGVYFSDQSTKSLNYAWGYWDGRQDDNCFMFVANVAMGKYYTPPHSMGSLPKPGYESTYAEGGKSGVANNEMIVYRTSQIQPMFLVEFSRGGR